VSVHEHRERGPAQLPVVVITVSDTRTQADDSGGALLVELLEKAGHRVVGRAIVRDEVEAIRAAVDAAIMRDDVRAVLLTGGTGIAPRDVTYEAIDALLEKRLDGFGEAFRRLSWDEIGPRAILSRALAGTVRGRLVVALPGSPAALLVAVEKVLAPVLEHAVGLSRGTARHHRAPEGGKV